MVDTKRLKVEGLRFGRSLQTVVKMVNMFSADHASASVMLRRSYDLLNPLLKQSRFLTFGFVEQRILLNTILTADDSLKALENDFLKRGIGAVSFVAGMTWGACSRGFPPNAANAKLIEESGGLLPFLESRQLEFVRVFPAVRNETRNEDGDTVLEMGSEEYLISKALSNISPGSTHGIEAILGHLEAGGAGEGGGGSGIGGGGSGSVSGGSGGGATGSGGGEGGHIVAAGQPSSGGLGNGGYVPEIQRLAVQRFEASLRNPDEDPQKSYMELARMLSGLRQDSVLSNLTGATAGQGETAHKEEGNAEGIGGTHLAWALRPLAAQ